MGLVEFGVQTEARTIITYWHIIVAAIHALLQAVGTTISEIM